MKNNSKIYFHWKKSSLLILILFLIVSHSFAQNKSGYHVIKTFHVGGQGWWDYLAVNSSLKRIYVSHGTEVNILDEISGDSIGIIPNTEGVHGIAFASPFEKGYTSNGRSNTVSVFNLKTNEVLKQIDVGRNPDAIIYDPFSKKIFVCNGRSNDASVIDPSSDKVVASINLNGKPEAAVPDNKGNVYVNIEDKSEIVKINMKNYKIDNRWKIGKGEAPSGLAIDKKNGILFSGCDNKLMIVLNIHDGKVLAELPIGEGCDGVVFDNKYMDAFSSNREGTLTMVHEDSPDKFHVVANIPTKSGARTSTIDEKTHNIFLSTADFEPAPAPTADNPHPRPKVVPNSFVVLEVGK
jgi:YVTN family beta-propeller protein